jgi:hypothetical protein
MKLTTHLHIVLRSRMYGYLHPQYVFMVWCSVEAYGQLYLYLCQNRGILIVCSGSTKSAHLSHYKTSSILGVLHLSVQIHWPYRSLKVVTCAFISTTLFLYMCRCSYNETVNENCNCLDSCYCQQ